MLVRRLALVFAAIATAGVTACGADSTAPTKMPPVGGAQSAYPGGTPTPGGTASPGLIASPGTTAAATPTVKVWTVAGKQVLVDQDNRSLYVFLKDTPKVSTCVDECATTWPPLWGPAEPGEGVDTAYFGTTTRPDGKTQATYYDKPLYYYQKDTKPGDANGQGVGGAWYLVDAKGNPVK